jgi:hypothetical protein
MWTDAEMHHKIDRSGSEDNLLRAAAPCADWTSAQTSDCF